MLRYVLTSICLTLLVIRPLDAVEPKSATAVAELPAPLAQNADYPCYFTDVPVTVDGKADEDTWKHAAVLDNFSMPWVKEGNNRPPTATRAKLLWDRQYIYFFADMDDSDLYADINEHDGTTWDNDVFELFLKPAVDKPGYYEFQVTPNNTRMDMFLPRRGAGGFDRFKADGTFDFQTDVKLRGTLNDWTNKDEGWSVEGRIAWKDFARTGGRPAPDERWTFALCRYDYSVDFEGPALSTSAPLNILNFHHYEDYAGIKFVAPQDSPRAEAAPAIGIDKLPQLTTSRVLGSPDPPLPFTVERVFDKLPIECPVTIARQPGSNLVWIVTQPHPYQPTQLLRFESKPDVDQLETLLPVQNDLLMYDIAFHPNFAKNGYVFIGMNGSFDTGKKLSRITRYQVLPTAPYTFDTNSATTIIEWESDGHNGAALAFGADGMLYITSGDGTSDSDANLRGQDLTHLTAKVLRIDVDGAPPGKTYRLPDDNPFIDREKVRPETWCYGLRNPWRITADPVTGQIWVGNNGQDLWEQVYLIERGANYGWSIVEGGHPFYADRQPGPDPIRKPTADHPHSEARSLTGGIVVRSNRPELKTLEGAYVYGDYSTGKIWGIKHDGKQVTWQQEIADTPLTITAFAHGSDGDVWALDHLGRGIFRLVPTPPDATQHAFPRKLSESGLFTDVAAHKMAAGVVPYSVNSPLWSDGTHKVRYFGIPHHRQEGRRIGYTSHGGWHFPNESILVKSFALETVTGDPSSHKWIETRFMVRQQNEWVGYSYRWNEAGTDAELVEAAGADQEFIVADPAAPGGSRTQRWHYPSRAECMVCHSRAANYVLGLQTIQMNRDHDYGGVVANQLRTLEYLQLLNINSTGDFHAKIRNEIVAAERKKTRDAKLDDDAQAAFDKVVNELFHAQTATRDQRSAPAAQSLFFDDPSTQPAMPNPYDESAPLAERARSYLHSNCAHCHVPAGGGNSKLDLAWTTPLDRTNLWNERPSHHTFGLKDARLIAPGHPKRSVLLQRVRMRGPGQMPQLATSETDQQAVDLLRRWIKSTTD